MRGSKAHKLRKQKLQRRLLQMVEGSEAPLGSFKNAVHNPYSNFMRSAVSMAKFKIILSDPETGKSQTVELEGSRAVPLVGRRLGETIEGTAVGLGGHKLRITGGSDKDGFPMRSDVHGGVKTRIIIAKGVGHHPTRKGKRRRKTMRGNVITEEIVQINMRIAEKPKKKEKTRKEEKEEAAKTDVAEAPSKVPRKPGAPKEPKTDEKSGTQAKKKSKKTRKKAKLD